MRPAVGLLALLSHWRRHPFQLAMLLVGLSLAGHGGPAAQVVPAEGGFDHGDVGGVLEDGVVDRDSLDGRELLFEHLLAVGPVPGGRDGLEMGQALRLPLGQGRQRWLQGKPLRCVAQMPHAPGSMCWSL